MCGRLPRTSRDDVDAAGFAHFYFKYLVCWLSAAVTAALLPSSFPPMLSQTFYTSKRKFSFEWTTHLSTSLAPKLADLGWSPDLRVHTHCPIQLKSAILFGHRCIKNGLNLLHGTKCGLIWKREMKEALQQPPDSPPSIPGWGDERLLYSPLHWASPLSLLQPSPAPARLHFNYSWLFLILSRWRDVHLWNKGNTHAKHRKAERRKTSRSPDIKFAWK